MLVRIKNIKWEESIKGLPFQIDFDTELEDFSEIEEAISNWLKENYGEHTGFDLTINEGKLTFNL